MHAHFSNDNDYLNSIVGDIWYYETIVLLASLTNANQLTVLISIILAKRSSSDDSAYFSMLAAECLESSSARNNSLLTGQVFDALKGSILSPNTTKVDKVECWHTLGRLQFGGVRLSELPKMINDDSRFVREEALKIIASLASEPIPGCSHAELRLLKDARKLFSIDRLVEYRKWVFAKPLRSFSVSVYYIIAFFISILYWASPLPCVLWLAKLYFNPQLLWWILPVIGVEVLMAQIYLWLNENKRLLRNIWEAPIGTLSRISSDNVVERQYAKRSISIGLTLRFCVIILIAFASWRMYRQEFTKYQIEILRQVEIENKQEERAVKSAEISKIGHRQNSPSSSQVIDANNYIAPETPDPNSIRAIAYAVSSASDVSKLLTSNNLVSKDVDISKLISEPRLREDLTNQLREFADYIDVSPELGYKTQRANVAEVITLFLKGENNPARKLSFTLRRESRTANIGNDYLRFDHSNQSIISETKEYPEQIVIPEIDFLTQSFNSHSYLTILYVNNIISAPSFENAENTNDEHWFATASKELLLEVKKLLLTNPSMPVPRSSLVEAFGKLAESIGKPSYHPQAVKSALVTLATQQALWLKEKAEREEAYRLAKEARMRAEEARLKANDARIKLVFILVLIVFFIGCAVLLTWKYIIPRLQLSKLDASLTSDVAELVSFVRNNTKDLALRKAVVRKLARSDTLQAINSIKVLADDPAMLEPIRTEAHRALHQIQRRQMRRVST